MKSNELKVVFLEYVIHTLKSKNEDFANPDLCIEYSY